MSHPSGVITQLRTDALLHELIEGRLSIHIDIDITSNYRVLLILKSHIRKSNFGNTFNLNLFREAKIFDNTFTLWLQKRVHWNLIFEL